MMTSQDRWTLMLNCVTMERSHGTRQPSPRAPVWWTSPTSRLTVKNVTWPLVPGPTTAIRYLRTPTWDACFSSPVSLLYRLTSLWDWTAATYQTLWKMWSGSVAECQRPRTSSCTAAALTRTRTSRTPCCCRGVPPFTSSTSSFPASSSPSWLLWVSTCLQTLGRRFPLGWLFFWLSLCSSWWWLRACLHPRACRL